MLFIDMLVKGNKKENLCVELFKSWYGTAESLKTTFVTLKHKVRISKYSCSNGIWCQHIILVFMGKLILRATNEPNPSNSSDTFFSDTMKTKRKPLQCLSFITDFNYQIYSFKCLNFQHTHHGLVFFANFCRVMDCESNCKLGKQTVCSILF